ncbi:hypothetical protein PMAYCL1PPCAC_19263 [Pristionchus mayeri]|uniref:LNR domain-containing protein n=1 Tax=Pristionchus mayeri TaxID=1317129 RepID=A0AAN5CQZ9_9BILA|nr:hypothetical protein PMAYCL1PPCAC_19263 [Pristionchus mayeri]
MHLSIFLSLVLFSSLFHTSRSMELPPERFEEEARQAISGPIRERSRINRLKYGHATYDSYLHKESDEEKCSDYCQMKLGDGTCNPECYTRGCTFDFGDCSHRPFRPCSELACPSDGRCDSDCALQGCSDGCDLEGGVYHEFLLFHISSLSPLRVYNGFDLMEDYIQDATGLVLRLEHLYGFTRGHNMPFTFYFDTKSKPSAWTNSSIAIFRVVEGYFDPRDNKTLKTLEGKESGLFNARVSPMILSTAQRDTFDSRNDLEKYGDKREELKNGRNRTHRRHMVFCPDTRDC